MLSRAAVSTFVVAVVTVATLVVAGGAAAARGDLGPVPTGVGALLPTPSHEGLPLHGGTVDSLNWSGYAVTPSAGGVTAVSSTFTVPSAGLVPPGFAATWTGIGG